MNFYTSSSRYLLIVAALFTAYMGVSIWSNHYVAEKGLFKDNEKLLFVQLDKIRKTDNVEIAFVGDSSLGNAIDAKLVEKVTGKKAVNLALTGSFGYSGSYNMARRVYDRNRDTLKYLVIMQTLDVAGRGVSADLYRKTECLGCGDSLPVLMSSFLDKEFFISYFGSWVDAFLNKNYIEARFKRIHPPEKKKEGDTEGKMDYDPSVDYYAQGHPHPADAKTIASQHVPQIHSRSMMYLRYLGEFCADKGLTCIYLHGPIYDGLGKKYSGYRAVLDSEIEKNFKGKVSGGPYLMKKREVGDSLDHVRPDFKGTTTRYYLDKAGF